MWDSRGLLDVHLRYDPRTRTFPKWNACHEGFDGFVTSTAAPLATGWSDPVGRAGLAPAEDNHLSQRTRLLP